MSVATHPPRTARLRRLAIVGGVAAAAVVAAVVISSSGGSSPAPAPAARRRRRRCAHQRPVHRPDGARRRARRSGRARHRHGVRGPAVPRVRRGGATTLPTLLRDDVRTGDVKLEARTLQFIGPDSVAAARAAAGAEAQGKLWPFLAAFYANQGQENSGYATDDFLRGVATSAGVDAGKALAHAQTDAAADRLNQANAEAQTRGHRLDAVVRRRTARTGRRRSSSATTTPPSPPRSGP